MPELHREVELKYSADDEFELPSLVQLVADVAGSSLPGDAPLADGVAAEQRLEAVYFDTADLRLAAAGLTLRRRTGGDDSGWHLKVPAGTATRSEVRLPPGRVPPGRTPRTVPAQLQSMVWAQTFGAPCSPVARITHRADGAATDRRDRAGAGRGGRRPGHRAAALPTDGTGEAVGAATSWREIEVELRRRRAATSSTSLDDRLRSGACARRRPRRSWRTCSAGAEPSAAAGRTAARLKLTTKSPAGEVLLTHIREQVAQVQAQDLPVRLDAPDAVHKMRVATRRLRSALTTFKPLFEPDVDPPAARRAQVAGRGARRRAGRRGHA